MQWSDKRVVVTGGAGFLGSFIVEKLQQRGCKNVFVPRSVEFDLRERDDIVRLYEQIKPHIVLHLAALVGGIGAVVRQHGPDPAVPVQRVHARGHVARIHLGGFHERQGHLSEQPVFQLARGLNPGRGLLIRLKGHSPAFRLRTR